MIELSLGVITKGFDSSNSRLENAKGDALVAVKGLTLGLKSKISVALSPVMYGISLEYLSEVNEFTENKSPLSVSYTHLTLPTICSV